MNLNKWYGFLVLATLFLTGCDNQNSNTESSKKNR